MLDRRLGRVENAMQDIAQSLQALTRLEVYHKETKESINRAFIDIRQNRLDYEKSCEDVNKRLRIIETQLPILTMTSRWVIAGTIAIISAVFIASGAILLALGPLIVKTLGG